MLKRIIFAVMIVLSGGMASGQPGIINVIPQPVEVKAVAGSWELTENATIIYNKTEGSEVAKMLVRKLSQSTGYALVAKLGKTGEIRLILHDEEHPTIGREGYLLTSSAKGVLISANQPAGLFYGVQTLLQLFSKEIESKDVVKAAWTIPLVSIIDYPRLSWRGLMLDVSRNFFTKEEVKRYIDEMTRFKFNTFHWHLTDDHGWRIQIKSLPKLTEIGAWRVPRAGQFGSRPDPLPNEAATDGGFYTQEDIKEIIQYAEERFVTIVPEIDVPGHSTAAIASYPELSCTKNRDTRVNPGTNFAKWYGDGTFKMFIDNNLNPSDEKVYEFLDKVFTEVAALFPGQYIHIGGDECYKGFWEADSGCQALMKAQDYNHIGDLQGYFMKRVEAILSKNGKRMLGWDEIMEGDISRDAAVMSWHNVDTGIRAAGLGHPVIMTPTAFCYLDYAQGEPTVEPPVYSNLRLHTCYSFNPVPEGADATYIIGGQGNLWTEQIATLRHAEYMTWPRGWALSEVFWTPEKNKNWESFIFRVENQFIRSDIAQVKYSRAMYDAMVKTRIRNGRIWIEMQPEVPGLDLYYTIDGSMPDHFSPKYTGPIELPEGPVSLRVITYRDSTPIGHLITLKPEDLKGRVK